MQMSDCSPRTDPRGFTLLEMLVVMVILAAVAAISAPRLTTLYDSVRAAAERDDVLDQVRSLGNRARQRGHSIALSGWPEGDGAEHLDLPDGWLLSAEPALQFMPSGLCKGGQITLQRGSRNYHYYLQAPYCEAVQP